MEREFVPVHAIKKSREGRGITALILYLGAVLDLSG